MTDVVKNYIQDLFHIRASGSSVEETSYYPVLSNLLNEIGGQLKPKVSCIMNIANRGAGLPDGGLFTPDQFQNIQDEEVPLHLLPARGVIEAKGTNAYVLLIAEGEQVQRYLEKYNQVLITNFRAFVLARKDSNDAKSKLEIFCLAEDEHSFWSEAAAPSKFAEKVGYRLIDFIKRVILHPTILTDPEDVAWFMASYAREARARIDCIELPALSGLRDALEEALGLKFEGKKGDHFFRSTLVQTLFYGLFSAWVLWSKTGSSQKRFHWREAAWSLHLPIIRALFEQIATPSKLGPLKIDEILDWTEDVLDRVDKTAFFSTFEEKHAVQYFYEPFLEAFDPDLRKELGIWYTPPEVVQYMVSRVDDILKKELDIQEGLADRSVYILDPACGTGSYIVEVLNHIARNLIEKVGDALIADDLKHAALERVLGFEILPAPFVVAHLQVNQLLQDFGASLSEDRNERVGIYLTNSLTGWDFPEEVQKRLLFAEFETEREESSQVKRKKPILVVLGNPPYNGFAGVSPVEEHGLVEPYKKELVSTWGIKKFNLDDPYIRFFRLAERRIAEQTGKGVICYISNYSYISDPSFVVMRKRFLDEFDKIWIDCTNGSSRETGKRTPDGKSDPSIFSTKLNPEGIRVGTAICLLVRKPNTEKKSLVRFRHIWGTKKREELLESLNNEKFDDAYKIVEPNEKVRYSFRSSEAPRSYLMWPSIVDLSMVAPLNGPVERRGNSLIKFAADKCKLGVINDYLDPVKTNDLIRVLEPRFMESSGEFKAEKTRNLLLGRKMKYSETKIVAYPFKPLDVRHAYLDASLQPLFSRPSPELLELRNIPSNKFFITRDTADKYPEGPSLFIILVRFAIMIVFQGHA